MIQAVLTFMGELNDFLAPARRSQPVHLWAGEDQTVKHLVESCGVPHPEIGQITSGGKPVAFSCQPRDGENLQVFPWDPKERERSLPAGEIRFVLDMHLGKLARYLRLLGFDSAYRNDFEDDQLAAIAALDARVLLTRDRRLLMRKAVLHGYCPRSLDPRRQLLEVLRSFNLAEKISPFQRCSHCNERLVQVSKESILDRLEPLTQRYYDDFQHCPACGNVYWRGSHYERMRVWIQADLQAGIDRDPAG